MLLRAVFSRTQVFRELGCYCWQGGSRWKINILRGSEALPIHGQVVRQQEVNTAKQREKKFTLGL
jgi:hypothetical protein